MYEGLCTTKGQEGLAHKADQIEQDKRSLRHGERESETVSNLEDALV